uniref:Galectin n=1 Tax=Canis lupus familiaris TaxID=9615 RepID=A0A8C0YVP9_CANLF
MCPPRSFWVPRNLGSWPQSTALPVVCAVPGLYIGPCSGKGEPGPRPLRSFRTPFPPPPTRFYVNLLCGEAPGSEAALHFNPRLDESTVVFNTLEQGAWGREERGTGIPFQRGQPFDVLLIATDEGFKAVVGDSEYHHFRYRIPPARVRLLEVGGDLQLESVSVF